MNSSSSSSQLSVNHLEKVFSQRKKTLEVFSDISFSVNNHEFVSIIGPSGCGKSTIFNILSGVDQQNSGEIRFNKKVINDRKGKFGYMPQDASLLSWKTVLENVTLGLVIKGVSGKEAKEKAHDLLHKFGLADFANHYPNTLSGGMQQRVALLRTVLFHPEFLLLDEPFGSLDALTRHDAQKWLLSVWEELRSSVLFITHDIQEAILLSDRIYILSNRPATILREVKVKLLRPRKLSDLTTEKAKTIEKQLLSLLMKS